MANPRVDVNGVNALTEATRASKTSSANIVPVCLINAQCFVQCGSGAIE